VIIPSYPIFFGGCTIFLAAIGITIIIQLKQSTESLTSHKPNANIDAYTRISLCMIFEGIAELIVACGALLHMADLLGVNFGRYGTFAMSWLPEWIMLITINVTFWPWSLYAPSFLLKKKEQQKELDQVV